MGKTLVEKIIGSHAGKEVVPGELVIVDVDLAYFQDWTGPLSISQIQEMGIKKLKDPKRVAFFIDHSSPSSAKELATDHNKIRAFARETGATLYDVGGGVCHVITSEKHVKPGDIAVGSDSHTCQGGALGAFASGMGSTDVAVAAALGKTWLRVPESIRVEVNGKFPKGVYAKDLILYLIGLIGADGATYQSLEFHGDTIDNLPFHERLVVSNMAVEAGAKCGIFPSDNETRKYLKEHHREKDWQPLDADLDAQYVRLVNIDASKLVPMVAFPHTVDNTRTIDHQDCKDRPVNQVYIGTCTNGRYEDFVVVAKILKGKKVHPSTRLVITPGSRDVFLKMLKSDIMEILVEAGAAVNSPGCGACPGSQTGILGNDEHCISTMNRNFKGRMGNPTAFIYLASPATCAVSALAGKIADPREVI